MNKNLFYVDVSGIEIYIGECFFNGIKNRPQRWHTHPCYELVFIDNGNDAEFIITPPLFEHLSADASPENISSMLFSLKKGKHDGVFGIFHSVDKQVSIYDTFDGISRITSVKRLLNDSSFGASEHIEAELRLLFIEIARAISSNEPSPKSTPHMLDRERKIRLEEYFNVHIKNPNCSKKDLADELGVCERHLTRILNEIYGSSFSKILLRSRMTLAEAMREEGNKTALEISEEVGYYSLSSFKRAYLNFYGYPFKMNIKKDI